MGRLILSLQAWNNLLECDSFLARYYEYSSGTPSQMICPKGYAANLQECKRWALQNCFKISPSEKQWLRESHHRRKRSAWACNAGLLGIPRLIYESTGQSCESAHLSNLKGTLREMANSLGTAQKMIRVVNGKTVFLVKATEALHSRVAQLSKSLSSLDGTMQRWQKKLNDFMSDLNCEYMTHWWHKIPRG